jgi:hypothetical protein
MTKEQIHNIYLHMTGKAEGLLEAGAEADFPIMFAEAIIQYNKSRELTDEEIMVLYEEYIETQYASESNVLGFGRAILKKASEK